MCDYIMCFDTCPQYVAPAMVGVRSRDDKVRGTTMAMHVHGQLQDMILQSFLVRDVMRRCVYVLLLEYPVAHPLFYLTLVLGHSVYVNVVCLVTCSCAMLTQSCLLSFALECLSSVRSCHDSIRNVYCVHWIEAENMWCVVQALQLPQPVDAQLTSGKPPQPHTPESKKQKHVLTPSNLRLRWRWSGYDNPSSHFVWIASWEKLLTCCRSYYWAHVHVSWCLKPSI